MTQEIFDTIQSFQKYVTSVWDGSPFSMPREEVDKLESVYVQLPGCPNKLNKSCNECVKYALLVCQSYWEREAPKNTVEEPQPEPIVKAKRVQKRKK